MMLHKSVPEVTWRAKVVCDDTDKTITMFAGSMPDFNLDGDGDVDPHLLATEIWQQTGCESGMITFAMLRDGDHVLNICGYGELDGSVCVEEINDPGGLCANFIYDDGEDADSFEDDGVDYYMT